jgi:hypothetical protein
MRKQPSKGSAHWKKAFDLVDDTITATGSEAFVLQLTHIIFAARIFYIPPAINHNLYCIYYLA